MLVLFSVAVVLGFVLDAFSRKVVGWQLASHMRTDLVLDALRMALAQREPGADFELVAHTDCGSQYTSADYTQELDDHGVRASVGSVGDAYDLAETTIGLFKTEMIEPKGRGRRSPTSSWRPLPGSTGSITAGSMEPAVISRPSSSRRTTWRS